MRTNISEKLTDKACRFWAWLMGVFAIDDGDEEYDDWDTWADWETEVL